MIEQYLIHIAIIVGIYLILAISLNLVVGYGGLLNMSHIAFFGIGAYSSTLLTEINAPWFIAFLFAGIISAIAGYLVALTIKKTKGDYLALATLGFSFVVISLMKNWVSLTNGNMGLSGIVRPSFFGIKITSNFGFLILVAIIALIAFLVIYRITQCHFGKLLEAVRDNELNLKILGKDTTKIKCKAMSISAFFAGIAGSLYAHYISYIDPGTFSMSELILIFTIIIVGGLASLKGTVIVTLSLIILPEIIRLLSIPTESVGPIRQIIYALVLLVVILFKPKGLFGKVDLK